ncbi:unnamed protein product [Meloidogyne enterolobii]|uniref:Uncharacterized protein n=1 Tax=Meloidogyne enterolobii TaxID=390850 RepID=A0ACB0Z2Z2_MELEN
MFQHNIFRSRLPNFRAKFLDFQKAKKSNFFLILSTGYSSLLCSPIILSKQRMYCVSFSIFLFIVLFIDNKVSELSLWCVSV